MESRLPRNGAFPMHNAVSERPISTLNKPDAVLELTLDPSLISEFTGQPNVKERLEIAVAAAFVLSMPRQNHRSSSGAAGSAFGNRRGALL